MDPKKNDIEITLISIFFLVLSVIGIVWCITSGLLAGGIDGILLIGICLMMAAVFALQLFLIALQAGWIKLPAHDKKPAAAAAPAKWELHLHLPAPWVYQLPAVNATLNATSALFLLTGFIMIRSGKVFAHRVCMITAFTCSTIFLVGYLYYHFTIGLVRFGGQGWIRPVYFTILTTHTILAIVIVPLVLITLTRALRSQFPRHRAIARWTFPLWLYVSVTGVIVYWLLYRLYTPIMPAPGSLAQTAATLHHLLG